MRIVQNVFPDTRGLDENKTINCNDACSNTKEVKNETSPKTQSTSQLSRLMFQSSQNVKIITGLKHMKLLFIIGALNGLKT